MAATAIHTPAPASRKSSNPGSTPYSRPTQVPQSQPSRRQPGPPAFRLSRKPPIAGADSSRPSLTGGQPLEPVVQEKIERSFNVDLSSVRVHSDTRAREAARNLSARAITYGSRILLGPTERSNDVKLMAHEAAHVVQQQGAPRMQPWAAGQNDRYEHEAHQASSAVVQQQPFSVNERTGGSRVQRLGLSNVLDYFADKANYIPGYRMFTIILGVNPINMSRVERSAANILRALIEFLPGGKLITDAMENHGVFEKIGKWVDEQIRTLGISGSAIKDGITRFLDSLGWSDILHPGDVWERAKRIFTDPIDRIMKFAKGMVTGILKFIKDAILRPLAKLAEGTRGYDLLRAILGEDPVTGEKYPRTAETLIGGFMKLIGQEEIWENMKKANAVPRAWAWFQSAMKELLGFVQRIPSLFVDAFKSLELVDIVLVPRAFYKIAKVFGGFILDFIRWGGNAVWTLLQIIFEVVAPGVMPYLKKAAAAFKTILKDPIGFVSNLVRAAKLGFQQFASNIGKHLKASLIQWLTGSLGGAGVYIPQSFEIRELIKFVLSVLGLTWQNIRQKLVTAVGETAVKAMETGVEIVVALITQGPAAAWEKIKEQLTNLKEIVIEEIMSFVVSKIVQSAITKLLSMLSPAGAIIQAIIAIYNTIMFFIERMKQIIQVVTAFIDSISAIASGVIAAAANRVEQTLAGLLTLAISFLARIAGLGKVSDAVINIINKIRAPIDKALNKVVAWIAKSAKTVVGKVKSAAAKLVEWWKTKRKFTTSSGDKHSIFFKGEGRNAKLTIASSERVYLPFIRDLDTNKDPEKQKAKDAAIETAKKIDALSARVSTKEGTKEETDEFSKLCQLLADQTKIFMDRTDALPASALPVYGALTSEGWGSSMTIEPLTKIGPPGTVPSASSERWDRLNLRREGKRSYYIRGHLLNHNIHGPGSTWKNMTPLSQKGNKNHLSLVERTVKEEVNKGSTLYYKVEAKFDRKINQKLISQLELSDKPSAVKDKIKTVLQEEQSIPSRLLCTANIIKLNKQTGKKETETLIPKDTDVSNTVEDQDLKDYAVV